MHRDSFRVLCLKASTCTVYVTVPTHCTSVPLKMHVCEKVPVSHVTRKCYFSECNTGSFKPDEMLRRLVLAHLPIVLGVHHFRLLIVGVTTVRILTLKPHSPYQGVANFSSIREAHDLQELITFAGEFQPDCESQGSAKLQ